MPVFIHFIQFIIYLFSYKVHVFNKAQLNSVQVRLPQRYSSTHVNQSGRINYVRQEWSQT